MSSERRNLTQSGSLAKADVREQDERESKNAEKETESRWKDYETKAKGEATKKKKKKILDQTAAVQSKERSIEK